MVKQSVKSFSLYEHQVTFMQCRRVLVNQPSKKEKLDKVIKRKNK